MAEMSECSRHEGAIYYEAKKCPVCAVEQDARDAVTLLLGAEAERDLVVARWEALRSVVSRDIARMTMADGAKTYAGVIMSTMDRLKGGE